MLAFRFSVARGKHFENGAFRKGWRHDNHVICLPEFSSSEHKPKWPLIVAFLISRGQCGGNHLMCFQSRHAVFKFLRRCVNEAFTKLQLEWFSFECRKTTTKVITLANHKEHRQYSEPIKIRSNYMQLTRSAGKCMRARHDWFWFYF